MRDLSTAIAGTGDRDEVGRIGQECTWSRASELFLAKKTCSQGGSAYSPIVPPQRTYRYCAYHQRVTNYPSPHSQHPPPSTGRHDLGEGLHVSIAVMIARAKRRISVPAGMMEPASLRHLLPERPCVLAGEGGLGTGVRAVSKPKGRRAHVRKGKVTARKVSDILNSIARLVRAVGVLVDALSKWVG